MSSIVRQSCERIMRKTPFSHSCVLSDASRIQDLSRGLNSRPQPRSQFVLKYFWIYFFLKKLLPSTALYCSLPSKFLGQQLIWVITNSVHCPVAFNSDLPAQAGSRLVVSLAQQLLPWSKFCSSYFLQICSVLNMDSTTNSSRVELCPSISKDKSKVQWVPLLLIVVFHNFRKSLFPSPVKPDLCLYFIAKLLLVLFKTRKARSYK